MLLMAMNLLLAACFSIIIYSVVRNISKNQIDLNGQSLLMKSSTDSLRGFSIIMIAFAHICQYDDSLKQILIGGGVSYKFIFSWGAIGVCLFFFLSGYGCYLSLNKGDKNIKRWLLQHVGKMLIHFVFAFVIVIVLMLIVFKNEMGISTILINFVTLRLPGSTVWYFKIQILFYLILALSMTFNKKRSSMIVALVLLGYAVVAKYGLNLQDFWWKTALCFPAGCMVAHYHDILHKYTDRLWFRVLALFLACLSYILLLKDGHYRIYVQLPAYVIIAVTISMFWCWLVRENRLYTGVGKASLDLYLVHIGIVEGVFMMDMKLNMKIAIFISLSAAFTMVNYCLSEKVYVSVLHIQNIKQNSEKL